VNQGGQECGEVDAAELPRLRRPPDERAWHTVNLYKEIHRESGLKGPADAQRLRGLLSGASNAKQRDSYRVLLIAGHGLAGKPELQREEIAVIYGPEFTSRALDQWAYLNGVALDFSRPGKPTDNAYIEAFNGRLRAECLNPHGFLSLEDASEKLEAWRMDYHEARPHGSLGYLAPGEFVRSGHASLA
jgi:putative transposase